MYDYIKRMLAAFFGLNRILRKEAYVELVHMLPNGFYIGETPKGEKAYVRPQEPDNYRVGMQIAIYKQWRWDSFEPFDWQIIEEEVDESDT